ncbi:MAG: hypothetical protein FWD69_01825 [Polyangiaceae bacterium]|nr:hypothetical protein [Polyangiaceae bacterium]
MAKAGDEWKVLRHGAIEQLAENLWRVSGDLPGMHEKVASGREAAAALRKAAMSL